MSPDPTRALALNCTLKAGREASSTDVICRQLLEELEQHGVTGDLVRVADLNIKPGVTSDEGDGDEWPDLRRRILNAGILILGTPIWLGQPSSVCKRVLERMDAFLGETDDDGRMVSYDRVAILATVGNEDGAHHVAAEVYQALNDCGYTIPAAAQAYWVGEAAGSIDYQDLEKVPDSTRGMIQTAARHAAHLTRLLVAEPYPAG